MKEAEKKAVKKEREAVAAAWGRARGKAEEAWLSEHSGPGFKCKMVGGWGPHEPKDPKILAAIEDCERRGVLFEAHHTTRHRACPDTSRRGAKQPLVVLWTGP